MIYSLFWPVGKGRWGRGMGRLVFRRGPQGPGPAAFGGLRATVTKANKLTIDFGQVSHCFLLFLEFFCSFFIVFGQKNHG